MEVDRSARSVVVVCTLPRCGTRDIVSTAPGAADAWLRAHLARAHVDDHSDDRRRVVAALSERERKRRS